MEVQKTGMTGLRALLIVAAVLAAPSAVAQPASRDPFVARILDAHNRARAAVGVPALSWNADLAEEAASWARHLAEIGEMRHSDNAARPGQGENLATGTAGYFGLDALVGFWSDEGRLYRPGVFPNVSRTGSWHDIGHYSQMVWRETTEVGCGLASGGGMDYLVCRYSPPGNVIGQQAY